MKRSGYLVGKYLSKSFDENKLHAQNNDNPDNILRDDNDGNDSNDNDDNHESHTMIAQITLHGHGGIVNCGFDI